MRLRIDINKDGTKNFYVMESYRTQAKKSTTRIVKSSGPTTSSSKNTKTRKLGPEGLLPR